MIYGLNTDKWKFWKELLKAFKAMMFVRSEAYPCMYLLWTTLVLLIVWISCINDCICFVREYEVNKIKEETKIMF